MTAIPNSNNLIQIEATRFRSAVSESTAQAMGGAINFSLNTLPGKADLANLNNTAAAAGVSQSGPFPYSSPPNTSLKVKIDQILAALNSTFNIVQLYDNAFSLGGGPSTRMGTDGIINHFTSIKYDNTNYTVNVIQQAQAGGTVTNAQLLDTGIPYSATRFAVASFANTNANIFMRVKIYDMVQYSIPS